MRYSQFPSERTQPHDSLLFGLLVSGALRRRQVESDHRSEFGREIVEDLGAATAQLHAGHQAAQTDAHGVGSNSPGAAKSSTERDRRDDFREAFPSTPRSATVRAI